MNENTKVEQTIREMEERITEINKMANEKMANASSENADKIADIRDNTVEVINEAINKIKATAKEDEENFKFDELLDKVINKSREATEFTAKRIKAVYEDPGVNSKLQETSKQINDAFDKLTRKDSVKTTFEKAKEHTDKTADTIGDFFNDPEVKENIDKTKDVIVDIAQAGTDALKRLFNTQGKDKGTDIPVEDPKKD
jgi:uncharacterized protein YpuA (DUF1002 family)